MTLARRGIDPTAVYKVDEAADLLRLGVNTVRKLGQTGRLRVVRAGSRAVRFYGADLITFLESGGADEPVNAPAADPVRRRRLAPATSPTPPAGTAVPRQITRATRSL